MLGRGLRTGAWVLLLILALGHSRLPLAALQATAWVKMYVTYTETFDSDTALRLVFSGEEPCSLCHTVVDFESANGDLSDLALSFSGWGLLPPTSASIALDRPRERGWLHLDGQPKFPFRGILPDVPPPKAV